LISSDISAIVINELNYYITKLVIIFLSLQFYLKKHDVILKVNQDIKASNIDKSTNP